MVSKPLCMPYMTKSCIFDAHRILRPTTRMSFQKPEVRGHTHPRAKPTKTSTSGEIPLIVVVSPYNSAVLPYGMVDGMENLSLSLCYDCTDRPKDPRPFISGKMFSKSLVTVPVLTTLPNYLHRSGHNKPL